MFEDDAPSVSLQDNECSHVLLCYYSLCVCVCVLVGQDQHLSVLIYKAFWLTYILYSEKGGVKDIQGVV